MMWSKLVILLALTIVQIFAEGDTETTGNERTKKLLPIFQVVRFPNEVCTGTTRNGTCYTAEECSNNGGTNEGSCASGFGVCCVFKLACGGTSSANNTYIVQSATTSLSSPCTYKICPCSSTICRIRYDFTTNTLATQNQQFTAIAAATAAVNGGPTGEQASDSQGSCNTDQMSITSPGAMGSPVICGTNTGQHMVLDSDGTQCQTVNFQIGGATTTSRTWDIYVSQFTCAQEDLGGPPGCLQYYTTTTGLMKSFGFPTAYTGAAALTGEVSHLKNQQYEICIRRAKSMCYICYAAWYTNAMMTSYGLGPSDAAAAAKSAVGSSCSSDYIDIPGGMKSDIAATTTAAVSPSRICGRFLNSIGALTTSESVCTRAYPFRLGVHFDDREICSDMDDSKAELCEFNKLPGGNHGFAIGFEQKAC